MSGYHTSITHSSVAKLIDCVSDDLLVFVHLSKISSQASVNTGSVPYATGFSRNLSKIYSFWVMIISHLQDTIHKSHFKAQWCHSSQVGFKNWMNMWLRALLYFCVTLFHKYFYKHVIHICISQWAHNIFKLNLFRWHSTFSFAVTHRLIFTLDDTVVDKILAMVWYQHNSRSYRSQLMLHLVRNP